MAVMLVFLAGCAGTAKHESTGEYIDDSAITTKVKAELLGDQDVSGLAINVETYKGKVQLSGFAESEVERAKAEKLARSVPGVRSVQNDILIRSK
jgi:Predicted periplasmic or secreted lipoprotein